MRRGGLQSGCPRLPGQSADVAPISVPVCPQSVDALNMWGNFRPGRTPRQWLTSFGRELILCPAPAPDVVSVVSYARNGCPLVGRVQKMLRQ